MQCPVCGGNGVLWVDNNGDLRHHFKHADFCPVADQTPPPRGFSWGVVWKG